MASRDFTTEGQGTARQRRDGGPSVTTRDIAALVATVADVLFTQFVDDDLGCASYLIGDEQAGIAVIIDPAYAIEQ